MSDMHMNAGKFFPVFFFLLLIGTFTLFWIWSKVINRQDDSED